MGYEGPGVGPPVIPKQGQLILAKFGLGSTGQSRQPRLDLMGDWSTKPLLTFKADTPQASLKVANEVVRTASLLREKMLVSQAELCIQQLQSLF